MNNKGEKLRYAYWFLGIMGGLIGAAVYIKASGILDIITSLEAFKEYIIGFGAKADLAFFIIQLASVIVAPIPSNISSAAGGMIFGLWKAFFISVSAIICGSIAVFVLARKWGKPFADRFISPKIANKYGRLLARKGDILLALIFFLPFFPDDAICIVAGLSRIKFSKFFIITLLTRPWGILAASAVGSADIAIRWWGWVIIGLIFAALYLFVSNYHRKAESQL
ncbi:TVP38/TMEM64 family protein [Lutispora sp.]|uniref:TVP38/TMEM64 family protein n=1 Tax=Lutispora sp. TaxID=2828727 RepID=UPI002B20C0E3|nr:TVP38/TMEM64 family protein [Lutispora sp.]MEA4962506.1 TVP38/TMEM64 family protein [Lutispora sp.]